MGDFVGQTIRMANVQRSTSPASTPFLIASTDAYTHCVESSLATAGEVRFMSQSGAMYLIQCASNLVSGPWENLTSPDTGNGHGNECFRPDTGASQTVLSGPHPLPPIFVSLTLAGKICGADFRIHNGLFLTMLGPFSPVKAGIGPPGGPRGPSFRVFHPFSMDLLPTMDCL
jgi:hypothetical protein